jgi:hypothetical protein
MRRGPLHLALIALGTALAACGGAQIPMHNGYRADVTKPWLHPKKLKLDDKKAEAKAHGELSYPARRRAVWYAIDTPAPGELDLRVDITPPDESVDEDFDLGFEVFDPSYKVIAKSDADASDAGELTKTKKLLDLAPGHYLVHLYLEARLDTAEYTLHADFKASGQAVEAKTDFPANVQFVGALPLVPLEDDAPKNYRSPTTVAAHPVVHHHVGHHAAPTPPPAPKAATLSARIIGLSIVSGGTQITVGRGTSSGAQAGMKGSVSGMPSATFTLAACGARTCTATVSATPDQLKSAGSVVLTP